MPTPSTREEGQLKNEALDEKARLDVDDRTRRILRALRSGSRCDRLRYTARCQGDVSISTVILESLAANGHGQSRSFDCFVGVAVYDEPATGRLGLDAYTPEEVVSRFLRPSGAADLTGVMERDELKTAERLIRYQLRASDVDAAARSVSRSFERDVDLWRLRGGRVSGNVDGDATVIVLDPTAPSLELLSLPAEPLDVLPRRLGNYRPPTGEQESSRVDDALLQLAQVRSAPPGTAIVNVWTAAESLFGGVVGETRAEAGPVMSRLAELLYLRDMFHWLGGRSTDAGSEGAPAGGSSRWGFERSCHETTELLDRLAGSDPLAWWRLKTTTAWKSAPRLRQQLELFGHRMEQVAARAYFAKKIRFQRG